MPEHGSMPQRVLSGFVALSASSVLVMICQFGYAAVTARLLPVDTQSLRRRPVRNRNAVFDQRVHLGLAAARRSEAGVRGRSCPRDRVACDRCGGDGARNGHGDCVVRIVGCSRCGSSNCGVGGGNPLRVGVSSSCRGAARQGRTPVVARRSAVAQLLGMLLGLVAVLETKASWSLAVASVAGAVISTALLGVRLPRQDITPSRPTREMVGDLLYSSKAAGMNLLRYGANLLTPWSIGRFAGVDALGAYNRATTLVTVPLENLQTALSYSLFPELRPEGPVFAKTRAFTQLMVLVTWPAVIAASLGVFGAGPFLSVLLGPQWGAAASIGGLAVLLGVIPMLGVPALSAVEAQGEFRISAVAWVVALLAIGIGSGWTVVTGDPRWAMLGLVASGLLCLGGIVVLGQDGVRSSSGSTPVACSRSWRSRR